MKELFNEKSIKIRIYTAIEAIDDPYEQNVIITELPSLAISAIVTDISPTSAAWKMGGLETQKTKQIIIEKKYRSLLENSYKILVSGELFEGWRISGKMQMIEEGEYLTFYCYILKI